MTKEDRKTAAASLSDGAAAATPGSPALERTDGERRRTRYELFVLGELMGTSLHGYHLHEILNRVLGPFRQMSWGALYPLIHELERQGLIAAEVEDGAASLPAGNHRRRHTYHITEAGRARFSLLMREANAYTADYPEIFTIKLNLFGHIDVEQQRAILRHHLAYLQRGAGYLHTEEAFVRQRVGIPEAERPHILRLLSYRLSGFDAELQWVEQELALMESQPPPKAGRRHNGWAE